MAVDPAALLVAALPELPEVACFDTAYHRTLSPEAFTTLASGMDLMGARSNSGEGGEDQERRRR